MALLTIDEVRARAEEALREHQQRATEAQIRSGNYRKRQLIFQGLPISIENEAGSYRRGRKPDGSSWESYMHYPYGYFRLSEGTDGDHVDCFVGANPDAPMAYVVRSMTVDRWDVPDEDKVMLGFDSEDDARAAFLRCYDDPRFLGDIVAIPVAALAAKLREQRGQFLKSRVLFIRTIRRS